MIDRAVFSIRPVIDTDRLWVRKLLREAWGEEIIVTHNGIYYPDTLPGFIAEKDGQPAGLITYRIEVPDCEIVTLNSMEQRVGIGTALVSAAAGEASRLSCRRMWLITTNDNLNALRFYQKRGFRLAALYPNAITIAREIKPAIPNLGDFDIPLRDEIELEMKLPKP